MCFYDSIIEFKAKPDTNTLFSKSPIAKPQTQAKQRKTVQQQTDPLTMKPHDITGSQKMYTTPRNVSSKEYFMPLIYLGFLKVFISEVGFKL